MIKLLMNRWQIRLLNSEHIELDWYYLTPNKKLKFLIRDLLHMPCVNSTPYVLLIYSLYGKIISDCILQDSVFSQMHKIGNFFHFCQLCIPIFLLNCQQMMLANLK